jgi:acyl carrier protein
MGLDSVELVLEAEESFGISLADDDVVRIVTVGQFYDAIMGELPCPKKGLCLSAVTFYRLRQALLAVTGRQREDICPKTFVEVLIPRGQRKAAWIKMQRCSGLRFPHLCLQTWAFLALPACLVLIGVIGIFAFAWPINWMLVAGVAALILGYWVVDLFFGAELPSHCQTVGGLAKAVLAKNFAKLATEAATCDREEVWESVRILVADQLGVDAEKVTKESRFVADLGMD